MTIPSGETSITRHSGNGIATAFDYEFKITDEIDLLVTQADSDGVETVLVLGSDYTVVGVGDNTGGSITLTTAPPTGDSLAIEDDVDVSQLTPYGDQGAFYSRLHETSYDKNLRVARKALTQAARAIKFPSSAQGTDTELPEPVSGKALIWNAGGTALINGALTLTESDSSLITYKADPAATETTVEAKLQESVSVKDFGAVGDGVTNDKTAIQLAITANTGSVYLPAGDYLLDLTTDTNGLSLSNPVRLYGDGKGITTLKINYAATKLGTGVSVSSNNVTIADMTIDINADNGSTVAVGLGQNSAGFKLINCEITGERSLTTQYWPHGIKLSDAANADNVELRGNEFHGLNIILFSGNFFGSSGNIAAGWNISGNSFKGCTGGITFNSQFSDSGADMPWRHITVTGNTFDDLGQHVGGDSMAYLTITGNSFINMDVGDGDAAIHLENLGENLVVADNTIHCASGGGIWVYPLTRNYSITGNVIEGPYSRTDTDDPSTYSTPNLDVVGIWLVNNVDGEPENVVVSGNVVTSCSSGIRVSNPYDNPIVQGNHISLCDAGIWTNSSSALNVSGNTVKKCKYMYDMSAMRGVVGKNLGVDCTNLAYSPFDDFALLGLQWAVELTGDLAASTTTSIDLFTAPDRTDVDVISNVVRDSLASDHFIGTSTITKDNTPTFTATRGYYISTGSIILGAIPFSESAGTLRIDIFNNDASIQNAKIDLDFDGMMLWS